MTAGDRANDLQIAKNEGVYVTTATKDQFYYYRKWSSVLSPFIVQVCSTE